MSNVSTTVDAHEGSLVGAYQEAVIGRTMIRSPGDPPPTKQYAGARRVPLHWPGPGAPGDGEGDLDWLNAALLAFAPTRVDHLSPAAVSVITGYPAHIADTGRYGGGSNALRRSAPSGGAFYPGEIYLSWNGSLGLAAGLYHYDQVHHCLELLRTGDPAPHLAEALRHPVRQPNALLLTCRPWKNTQKYTTFSYQITATDIGVLAAQALTVFPSGRVHLSFDSARLDDLLALDSTVESVYAVVECGGPAAPSAAPLGAIEPGLTEHGLDVDREVLATVHTSALALHDACRAGGASTTERPAAAPAAVGTTADEPVRLPAPSALDLRAALPRRRSSGGMRPGLTLAQLSDVLAHAGRELATDPVHPDLRPLLWCAVSSVQGIAPGAYRYDPASHTLTATNSAATGGQMTQATDSLSGRLLNAGATIYAVAGCPPEQLDPLSYRLLLILTGAVVQRICLSGAAVGAATRPALSFVPTAVRTLLTLPPGHTTMVQVHLGTAGPCPGLLSVPAVDPVAAASWQERRHGH
ncbi:nitroreductase family protein [Micromonospora profundi]|uniref:hypothetical protein n=1 Tax=Micromonospora profundi TaxID=1420889 RepID=UPI0036C8E298